MKESGKIPSERDMLMISVIGVMRISRQSLTRVVGHGSRSQCLLGEEEMILCTYSSETGLNARNFAGDVGGLGCSPLQDVAFNTALILSILSLKNLPKEFARVVLSEHSGRGLGSDRCRIEFMFFQSCLMVVIRHHQVQVHA